MEPDEHLWRLVEVMLGFGATSTFVCELCSATLVVGPGEPTPSTC